jgi:hypothetical protein
VLKAGATGQTYEKVLDPSVHADSRNAPNAPGERRPTGEDVRYDEKRTLWPVRSTALLGRLALLATLGADSQQLRDAEGEI